MALVAVGLVLGACELRVQLNIEVRDGGSGAVEVAIALDDEALQRRPDLADDLDLDDLVEGGWTVTGPTQEADGDHWLRASHPFTSPAELGVLVDEVAGPDGPFVDFGLARADAFAETAYLFEGTVDFTRGLDGVTSDPELADALGEEPRALLEERLGAVVDELVTVQVAVRLPGEVDSNAPMRAANGAVWQPSVLEREAVPLRATGTVARTDRLVWAGVAVAAGLAAVLYASVRIVLWRRRRDTPAA